MHPQVLSKVDDDTIISIGSWELEENKCHACLLKGEEGRSGDPKDKMVIVNIQLGFIKRKSHLTNLVAFYHEKAA